VGRMRRLVEDVLALEMAEESGHAPEDVVVGEVIDGLVDALVADGLTPDLVTVDVASGRRRTPAGAVAVERIVENLVLNACKYAPAGSTVRVICDDADDGVRIRVQDEGPGVSRDDRELIFEPFEQAGRERGGVGLGLHVARRFAELAGGRIWVEDSPTGGAAFHVWLPGSGSEEAPPVDGRRLERATGSD